MLKQQETMGDVTLPAALPPLNNLPQWSRVNTLDKARYPKPFLKDRLHPLPNPSPPNGLRGDSADSDDRELVITDNTNTSRRIQHLEKNLNFLRLQHQEVLTNLHDEIDHLKRENKELQFRVVMIQKSPGSSAKPRNRDASSSAGSQRSQRRGQSSSKGKKTSELPQTSHLPDSTDQHSESQDEKLEELKVIFLEEELKELRKALKEEKTRNYQLNQLLEDIQNSQAQKQREMSEDVRQKPSSAGMQQSQVAPVAHVNPLGPLPFNATVEPLEVHLPTQPPRPPTLQECEIIIRHLQGMSDKQYHELNQLKSDLRDVLYSHKWTPDAYLLAKAYVAEDDAREHVEDGRLPKIALRQPSRKLPDIAYIQRDALSLPALKQTMGNKAIERRKRTQILQKARMRREIVGQNAD